MDVFVAFVDGDDDDDMMCAENLTFFGAHVERNEEKVLVTCVFSSVCFQGNSLFY